MPPKGLAGGDQTGPPQTEVASLSSGEERGPMGGGLSDEVKSLPGRPLEPVLSEL